MTSFFLKTYGFCCWVKELSKTGKGTIWLLLLGKRAFKNRKRHII
jgi:hypothetical protein